MEEYEDYLKEFLKNKDMTREQAEELCTMKLVKEYYLEKERQQKNILRAENERKNISKSSTTI